MVLSDSKNVKRLAIYFFYDKDGIVDDYIPYLLSDLIESLSELLIVCNGKLSPEGREKFEKLTSNILVRENIGFDVWAYKEGLESIGWDNLEQYDEIILMNFTIMGPLYPFSEMFEAMNNRDIDFWGITKHHGFSFDPFGTIPFGYIPEHIQSSFICIRNKMLKDERFQSYWHNMPPVNSYGEAVGKHEAIFTKKFENYGLKSDVYIQTDDLKDLTHYPLMIEPLELVKNRRCPVIKRKSFTNEYYEFLNCTLGEPTLELYEYIKSNLSYDVNLIWDNLLRVENMSDIKNRMHFNYVLSEDYRYNEKVENKKIALFLYIHSLNMADYCLQYAKSMPEYADIYVSSDTDEKIIAIGALFSGLKCNQIKTLVVQNRGRDVSAFLIGFQPYVNQYDYICFAHDEQYLFFEPHTIGKSFSYKCFENVLASKQYVENIINTFEKEQRLGMLMPPPPNHASFYGILGSEWGSTYDIVKKLAEDLNIHVNMNFDKEPISPLCTMFWFRPQALSVLFKHDWKYEDFPKEPIESDETIIHAIKKIYGLAVQAQGFFPAWVMSDHYARIEITNLHFMLREQNIAVGEITGQSHWGFDQAMNDLRNHFTLKLLLPIIVKQKLRKYFPKFIWNNIKRVYRVLKK